jgi:hypothetical protein
MGSALVTPDLHAVGDEEWSALLTRLMSALSPGGGAAGAARSSTQQRGATW